MCRPNRFVAEVKRHGTVERVHVKNTGRCRELLRPQARVILAKGDRPGRKTAYDLVMVEKPGLGWVNLDSQAPNRLVREWLQEQGITEIFPEQKYNDSRMDFRLNVRGETVWMEVKGCTLEVDGQGYFPDAPTVRGTRHLHELIRARQSGCRAIAAFVIQMEGVSQVLPNEATDPRFAQAWRQAASAGVEFLFLPCEVKKSSVRIVSDLRI